MIDVLHVGIFSQEQKGVYEAFDINGEKCRLSAYVEWATQNGNVKLFKSYDEYLCAFLKCLSVTVMQHLPSHEISCDDMVQHQWIVYPKNRHETIDMVRLFVTQHQHIIFKAMKELVHNRQVYINNSTLEHLEAMFSQLANFMEQADPNHVIIITPLIK